jgi:hypothetical protein
MLGLAFYGCSVNLDRGTWMIENKHASMYKFLS